MGRYNQGSGPWECLEILPMRMALLALMVAGLLPLGLAWRANRGTSLTHALGWAIVSWLGWGLAVFFGDIDQGGMEPARYCALCLTGCAGIAVLGARRPQVFAWNFVVLGLFAVMTLPLWEAMFLGTHPVDGLRIFFVAATIAVGVVNYLPTRLAPAALLLLVAMAAEIVALYAADWLFAAGGLWIAHLLLMSAPWLAWICLAERRAPRSDFDRLWLSFRDHWGLVWSQRVREQFNHAAVHAGWPVHLYWQGLVLHEADAVVTPGDREKMLETLRAVLQRFLADGRP
jgi:hypothetical protein